MPGFPRFFATVRCILPDIPILWKGKFVMGSLILGNLCSLMAAVTDSISSTRKTAKGVLLVQILSQLFYGAGAVILKGYSAAVQNGVSILRNLVAIRSGRNRYLEWFLLLLGVVLGILFNNRGIIGWLPVAANLEYSLAVFRFQDNERALKFAFLITLALFILYNVVILNIVGAVTNAAVLVTTAIFLIKERKTGGVSEKN